MPKTKSEEEVTQEISELEKESLTIDSTGLVTTKWQFQIKLISKIYSYHEGLFRDLILSENELHDIETARCLMGHFYASGRVSGISQNNQKAIHCFEEAIKAIEQKNQNYQIIPLYLALAQVSNKEKQHENAIEYSKKILSREQNNKNKLDFDLASINLAYNFGYGFGITKDESKAKELINNALLNKEVIPTIYYLKDQDNYFQEIYKLITYLAPDDPICNLSKKSSSPGSSGSECSSLSIYAPELRFILDKNEKIRSQPLTFSNSQGAVSPIGQLNQPKPQANEVAIRRARSSSLPDTRTLNPLKTSKSMPNI